MSDKGKGRWVTVALCVFAAAAFLIFGRSVPSVLSHFAEKLGSQVMVAALVMAVVIVSAAMRMLLGVYDKKGIGGDFSLRLVQGTAMLVALCFAAFHNSEGIETAGRLTGGNAMEAFGHLSITQAQSFKALGIGAMFAGAAWTLRQIGGRRDESNG